MRRYWPTRCIPARCPGARVPCRLVKEINQGIKILGCVTIATKGWGRGKQHAWEGFKTVVRWRRNAAAHGNLLWTKRHESTLGNTETYAALLEASRRLTGHERRKMKKKIPPFLYKTERKLLPPSPPTTVLLEMKQLRLTARLAKKCWNPMSFCLLAARVTSLVEIGGD